MLSSNVSDVVRIFPKTSTIVRLLKKMYYKIDNKGLYKAVSQTQFVQAMSSKLIYYCVRKLSRLKKANKQE